MLFTQIECIIFVSVVVSLLFLLKSNSYRKTVLLTAGIYFYSYFDYRIIFLLLLSIIITYFIATCITSSSTAKQRNMWLAAGVISNVAVLLVFKYFNFFVENINAAVPAEYLHLSHLDLIIPLGISFYTFRFVSYLVDVYRNDMDPGSIVDFLLYGTFFPIIVSGPIARASTFLPQLADIHVSADLLYKGYRLFVLGLFLKVFVADRVASYVNYFYSNNEIFGTLTAWMAVVAYSVEIYCDFAGYSSMAIGIACMLGIHIERNFDFPYLAGNIREFWQRWHMTLSRWIKNYLYIPLGGGRKGVRRRYLNYLIVMILCGCWHGAAWNFILWGGLHGGMLVIHNMWRKTKSRSGLMVFSRFYAMASTVLTFLSVTLCWVLFRSENIQQFSGIMRTLFSFNLDVGMLWIQPFVLFILFSFFVFHLLVALEVKIVTVPLDHKLTPTVLLCFLWLIVVFFPEKFEPFVYLQF